MAIYYALAEPSLDVVAVTTVYGNVPVDVSTENALRLLEIAGRTEIPVARGAAAPIAMPYRGPADFVHGSNGQGDVALADPSGSAVDESAAQLIVETTRRDPGAITIVTLGPLTNMALALMIDPTLPERVAGLVCMGGNAYVAGNATPTAEANIVNDPEAADLVLGADWPATLCGLDVTHAIVMTGDDLDRISSIDTAEARHLARILPFYRSFYASRVGSDAIFVHDSTTISYLVQPDAFQTERRPVRVDTGAGIGRGKTWPGDWPDRPPVTICVGADGPRLVARELSALGAI
jgi:inosine-uridine nucleoside N-ribohydrolase